jgi:hypothetical protein
MLRRTLLLAALLAPLTALGQAISISPVSPYTKAQCESTSYDVVLNWSIPAGTTIPTGATYRVLVSTTSECSEAASPNIVASGIEPDKTGSDITGATNQRYPKAGSASGTLTVNTFVTKASAACSNSLTLYTCVQLINGSTILAKTNILQLQVLDGPPSKPVSVVVAPGEAALNVSWAEGTGGQVPTEKYTARAYALVPGCDPIGTLPDPKVCLGAIVSEVTTAGKSARLAGLAIGTTYGVDVTAYSGTGTPSEPSVTVLGTPIVVYDFWEQYTVMTNGAAEQGGCASGPAGVLSLLAVAGLLRAVRRRS